MKLQGLYIFYLQNQIKGGISRLAKSRKPQFTAVNEDLRDKRNAEINAEITLFADFGLLVQSLSHIHSTGNSTSYHRVVAYSQESHHLHMGWD